MDGLNRIACVLAPDSARLESFAEACLQLTPDISVRANEAVFLDFSRCQNLWVGRNLSLRLEALMRRYSIQGQLLWGQDPALTLAQAKFRVQEGLGKSALFRLPLEALCYFLDPFQEPSEEQRRKIDKLIKALRHLGFTSAPHLLELPESDLCNRFGEEAIQIYETLAHGYTKTWPRFRVPEEIFETLSVEFIDRPEGVETLSFLLKSLVDRVVSRIRTRGCRVSRLELRLILERSYLKDQLAERVWVFDFPLAQSSPSELLKLLKDRISHELQKKPLDRQITDMDLRVLELVPGLDSQRDLFRNSEEEKENWNALMLRLWERLGSRKAFMASPVIRSRPEASWNQKLEADKIEETKELLPERPLRLLPQPLRVFKEGPLLVEASQKKTWMGLSWQGPERLHTEWWSQEGDLRRDYYQVVTEAGEKLWVYKDPDNRLFLHGYFD